MLSYDRMHFFYTKKTQHKQKQVCNQGQKLLFKLTLIISICEVFESSRTQQSVVDIEAKSDVSQGERKYNFGKQGSQELCGNTTIVSNLGSIYVVSIL